MERQRISGIYALSLIHISQLLEAVQQGLFDKAKRNLDEHTYVAHTVDEVKDVIENLSLIHI